MFVDGHTRVAVKFARPPFACFILFRDLDHVPGLERQLVGFVRFVVEQCLRHLTTRRWRRRGRFSDRFRPRGFFLRIRGCGGIAAVGSHADFLVHAVARVETMGHPARAPAQKEEHNETRKEKMKKTVSGRRTTLCQPHNRRFQGSTPK